MVLQFFTVTRCQPNEEGSLDVLWHLERAGSTERISEIKYGVARTGYLGDSAEPLELGRCYGILHNGWPDTYFVVSEDGDVSLTTRARALDLVKDEVRRP